MATWNSRHVVKFDKDMGADYASCENSWSYGTVSDFLTIITKQGEFRDWGKTHPASESAKHYSKDEALALLETLIDWAETYEHEGISAQIVEKIKKSKEAE